MLKRTQQGFHGCNKRVMFRVALHPLLLELARNLSLDLEQH